LAGSCGTGRRRNPDTAGGHLTRTIHSEFVNYFRPRCQIAGLAFGQPGDVKENVTPTGFRTQKTKAFLFEIGNDGTQLFGCNFAAFTRGSASL